MIQSSDPSSAWAPSQSLRRFGLPVYWLLFALYTLEAGRHPGMVPDPASVRYPWRGVIATCVLLALFTGGLHLILRPRTFQRSWGRLAGALVFSIVLITGTVITFVTDLPGYAYVPIRYAMATFLLLLMLGAWLRMRDHTRALQG